MAQLDEARTLLSRYLSDEVPPMLVADAADDLFDAAPTVVAAEIKAWVANQYRGSSPLPVADYLFHAAKKLYVLEELDLVESSRMRPFLNKLAPLLIHACPEIDRTMLAENLRHIKDGTSSTTTAVVDRIHQPAGMGHQTGAGQATSGRSRATPSQGSATTHPAQNTAVPAARVTIPPQLAAAASELGIEAAVDPPSATEVSRSIERLNLLLDRLATFADATDSMESRVSREPALLAEILDEVAADSRDSGEFENRLSLMEGMGLPALTPGLVRSLGQSLPDWAPATLPEGGVPESRNPSARAMRQVIRLARDEHQGSARFEELIKLAVEEFNNGSIGRSVSLLDVAQRMIDAKEIDKLPAQNAMERAAAAIEEPRILEFAEDATRTPILRRFMDFFPNLQVDSLILELEHEERRDRRRNLIRLLEVHGLSARHRAIEILTEQFRGGAQLAWFVLRNLIHVVRTIPRDDEDPLDPEIDALLPASSITEPLPLVREALIALASVPSTRAETAIITRVAEIEDVLQGRGTAGHEAEELQGLLDTTVRLVGKISTSAAVECVVNHGLNRAAALGDAAERLTVLATRDLTAHPAALRRLIEAIEAEAPTKVFGINVKRVRRSERLRALLDAVSGTDTPAVRQALAKVVERFAGQDEALAAHGALQRLGTPAGPTQKPTAEDDGPSATLAGDLALFGLPGLIQNLADSHLSGTLTLHDRNGDSLASIEFENGLIWRANAGKLSGESAIFQLIERPVEAKFLFTERKPSEVPPETSAALLPVMPLVLESMRRFDEFERAAALVPDQASFTHTNRQPTAPEEENDADLLAQVWGAAARGAPPVQLEGEFAVDAFRIRRLYEHWVSEGSLVLAN
jgi:uncharacterized protein YaaW (UPF0174 family)